MSKKMQAQIDYWRISAERNWETAKGLFKLKHYDACLFYCHLVIEKILKGLVVERIDKIPPRIHDLERLALIAGLDLSDDRKENLKIITNFNMFTRYDDVKFAFYKRCTKEYTEKYFKISEDLFLWLKEKYQNK